MKKIFLLAAMAFSTIAWTACQGSNQDSSKDNQNNSVAQSQVQVHKASQMTDSQQDNTQAQTNANKPDPLVVLHTNMGDITIQLFAEKAPITVKNFLTYVHEGYYDSTVFHRVINNFMIQGGGYTVDNKMKPGQHAPIPLEVSAGLSNSNGTIAMARTNDPNSATSQFFINVKDNNFLNPAPNNPGYAVFGRVLSGMDVVEKIKAVPTKQNGMQQNWPVKPVIITSAEELKQ